MPQPQIIPPRTFSKFITPNFKLSHHYLKFDDQKRKFKPPKKAKCSLAKPAKLHFTKITTIQNTLAGANYWCVTVTLYMTTSPYALQDSPETVWHEDCTYAPALK